MVDWSDSDKFKRDKGTKTTVLFPNYSPLVVKIIKGESKFSAKIFLKGYQQSEELVSKRLVSPFLIRRLPQGESRGIIVQQRVKSLVERLDESTTNEGIELARKIGELDNQIIRAGKIPSDTYFDNLGLIGDKIVVQDCGRIIHKYNDPFPNTHLPRLSAEAFNKINLQCGRGNVIYSRVHDLRTRFGDGAFRAYKKGLGVFIDTKLNYRFTNPQYEMFRPHLIDSVESRPGSQQGDSSLILASNDLETTLEELSVRIPEFHHDVKQGIALHVYESNFLKVARDEFNKFYGKNKR